MQLCWKNLAFPLSFSVSGESEGWGNNAATREDVTGGEGDMEDVTGEGDMEKGERQEGAGAA